VSAVRRLAGALGIVGALLLPATGSARAATTTALAISTDRTTVTTQLGMRFAFGTTVSNDGSTATPYLIAHLNVLSLFPDVYVDPEDWSPARTVYLGVLRPGQTWTHTWDLQAVNAGTFDAYVAVFARDGTGAAPVTSPAVRVSVADRTTINPGGILPLAFGVPAFVGLLGGSVRWSRRRR
jgi:hypothetical protein